MKDWVALEGLLCYALGCEEYIIVAFNMIPNANSILNYDAEVTLVKEVD